MGKPGKGGKYCNAQLCLTFICCTPLLLPHKCLGCSWAGSSEGEDHEGALLDGAALISLAAIFVLVGLAESVDGMMPLVQQCTWNQKESPLVTGGDRFPA
jgi:hypothetical protein